MKLVYRTYYLDGGTEKYETDDGTIYCKDRRMTSNKKRPGYATHLPTVGRWFKGYPEDDNSNLIEDTDLIIEIEDAINIYNGSKKDENGRVYDI